MKTKTEKYTPIPSPLKWHGGKGGFHGKLAQWIISLMPSHTHYVEPFFGGGSVMLYKDPEGVSEVANDIHGELINFWRVLQTPGLMSDLMRLLDATPFSEQYWTDIDKECKRLSGVHFGTEPARAWAFFVHCRQSLAGRMKHFAPLSKSRTRRGMNEQASAWLTAIEGLPEVHARLKRVAILNRKACEVIQSEDSPTTLFYLDPPYLHETRATTGEYEHEMTETQHFDLLKQLAHIKGKFLLSGYHSPMYDGGASRFGWTCHEFKIVNNAAGGKKKREMVECVWTNV